MRTIDLGAVGFTVPTIAVGCMRINRDEWYPIFLAAGNVLP